MIPDVHPFQTRTVRPLPRQVRLALLVLAHLAAVAVVGAADYLSGPDYELRPFYIFPVASAAWFLGRTFGLFIALIATLSLFFANDYLGAAMSRGLSVPIWNTASRLTIYVTITLLTSQLHRQSHELRVKSDALLEESKLRDEYVALFVHELRHSAAAMALASTSLASSERLRDDERGYMGQLGVQARDLEQLASQLLAIGRMEGAPLELDVTTVDLRDLAASAATQSGPSGRVTVRPAPNAALVRADPDELRRALDNLVRNGLKYSRPPSPVEISVIERNGMRGLQVADQGVGFDPGAAGQLFRKYGRLRIRGGGGDGAGLGLYLTRLIVEAHGGVVEASSPGPGAGARFGFLLPRLEEEPSRA